MLPPECRLFLRISGLLVPARARARWLRDKESELWYRELQARRAGKPDHVIRARLAASAANCAADALWQRFDRDLVRARLSEAVRSPHFCVAALVLLLVVIAFASDGLARTRRILSGAGFGHGDRVVSICVQESLMGRRQGIAPPALRKWREQARGVGQLAAYTFTSPWYQNGFLLHRGAAPTPLPHALVTPEFFSILGVRAARGRLFSSGDAGACADCLVVTPRLRRALLRTDGLVVGRSVEYEGRRWRVIGELADDFWFVTQKLGGVSLMDAKTARGRVIGLGLLRPGTTVETAEVELRGLAGNPRIEVASLAHRLQSPLRTLGLGSGLLLALACAVTAVAILRRRGEWRFWVFFFAKTALGLTTVLLIAVDYGGAGELSITGGNQPSEPVAFWLWTVGTVLCIWWSIADQKMRCRTCQRRFVMPVRIGSPDRVLFEHEGTELVCPGGHGTLYVEGTTETFRQEGRWTKLDESWKDLFAGKP